MRWPLRELSFGLLVRPSKESPHRCTSNLASPSSRRSHSENGFHVKQKACKHQCALCPIPVLSACYYHALRCLAVTMIKRATDAVSLCLIIRQIHCLAQETLLRSSLDTTIKPILQGRQFQRVFSGNGADEDVVVGSARAYISALNKLISYYSASNQVSSGQEAGNGAHAQQPVAV